LARKLFLHVGTAKTGTTSIQNWLDDNRDALQARGLLYPKISHASDQSPAFNKAQHILAFHWGVGWLKPEPAVTQAAWDDLAAQAKAHAGDIVISSETFALALQQQPQALFEMMARAVPDAEITCVMYLRGHAELIKSDGFEAMRNGQGARSIYRHAMDPPWYLRDILNYRGLVTKAQASPHVARVVARPFERGQMPGGDLLEDFLAIVGLPPLAETGLPPAANANQFNDTNAIYLVLSQVVNLKFSKPRQIKRLCYDIAEQIEDNSGRFDWSPAFRDHLTAQHQGDRDFLDALVGGRFFQEERKPAGHVSTGVEDDIARELWKRLTGRPADRRQSHAALLNNLSEMDCAGLLEY
jgi:hypothetical protein